MPGMGCHVGVRVAVEVEVGTGVAVEVGVGVKVGVSVAVAVGDSDAVGVSVNTAVGVAVLMGRAPQAQRTAGMANSESINRVKRDKDFNFIDLLTKI